MNWSSCEHPVLVKDINGNMQYVSCGHCDTCKRNHALMWRQRLDFQSNVSAYTFFFTLTYADSYLPRLRYNPDDGTLEHVKREDFHFHYNSSIDKFYRYVDKNDFSCSVDSEIFESKVTQNILDLYDNTLPYLCYKDLQLFFKRVRKSLFNKCQSFGEDYSDWKVQYYYVGEYGPTTYRPHYHGVLFFDNPKIAECIYQVFCENWPWCDWTCGRSRCEPVKFSASSYVSSYLTASNHLPQIYQLPYFRQKSICSRGETIGFRAIPSKKVRELFERGACEITFTNRKGEIAFVPLWRSLESRLFPKLPRDCTLSSVQRRFLIRKFVEIFKDSIDYPLFGLDGDSVLPARVTFQNHILRIMSSLSKGVFLYDYLYSVLSYFRRYESSEFPIYIKSYNQFADSLYYDNSFIRFFYTISRIYKVLVDMQCSVDDFVDRYELFVKNKNSHRLSEFYRFQEIASSITPCYHLLALYPLSVRKYSNTLLSDLTDFDFSVFQSFQISNQHVKQIFDSSSHRDSFFRRIHFTNQLAYRDQETKVVKWVNDAHKTRAKNYYLEKNPHFNHIHF